MRHESPGGRSPRLRDKKRHARRKSGYPSRRLRGLPEAHERMLLPPRHAARDGDANRALATSALARALSDATRPAALLYPGPGAIDVVANPPPTSVTLVVVDGTWSQTRKVVRENPELARLPRYAFSPPSPSEYRIRREPDLHCVSTIEALVHVLMALEEDGERFRALLAPFRAMVDMQIEHRERLHGGRTRHKKTRAPRRPDVPACLRERPGDLVCVVGEANAWPYR